MTMLLEHSLYKLQQVIHTVNNNNSRKVKSVDLDNRNSKNQKISLSIRFSAALCTEVVIQLIYNTVHYTNTLKTDLSN